MLARRDLTATPDTVDLKATYGNDRLPEAFDTSGITDRTTADAAAANLEHELGRPGLDVFARPELDRLAAAVAEVDPHAPSGDQLNAVHEAVQTVRQKVNQRAVDDLALVNGVTGPQKLDDASAVLRAAADGRGGPLTPEQQKRLAGQLDDLAGHLQDARKDPKALRDLAADLRTKPELATPDRYRSVADQLTNDRAAVRKHEIDQRLSELADPSKGTKRPVTVAGDELQAAKDAVVERKNDIATYEKELADATDVHDAAKDKAENSAKAAKGSRDQAKKDEAKDDAKAAREAKAAVGKLRDKLDEARAKLPGDEQDVRTATAVNDRVTELYNKEVADTAAAKGKPVSKLTAKDKTVAARVAWARADVELVGQQYGGAYARAGAGENHPAGMFDQALTAKVEDVPALIEQITAGLSNSGSNLRFGDELVNKWVQNYLDPHVIRDPDLLTAVAHEQLPPEVLYAPHTADLLQAVRGLEANGLVPPELRDIMAPKTQDDLEQLVTGNKLSPSAEIVTDELGVPSPHAGKVPVSSSGDFTNRADVNELTDDQLNRLAPEGLYQPDRAPQPTPQPTPQAQPHPTADEDVVMTEASQHDAPAAAVHTPDGDVQMHDGTGGGTGRPDLKRRREDSDSDSDGEAGPSTVRRRLAGLDLNGPTPPPPPAGTGTGTGTGTRGIGSVPPPPPPPAVGTGHGFGSPASGHQPPPPPPSSSGGHDGASGSGDRQPVHETPVHETPLHAAPSNEPVPHEPVQHEPGPVGEHQPVDGQQPPQGEQLLPPPGTVERWLVQDPADLLSKAPVTVNYADGAMQRMPGLNQQQANSFVAAVEKADQHWFTLVPDRNNVGAGKNGFVLTPAWEKYVQHDPSFPHPPAGLGLPPAQPDHHYVTGSYVPYKTGRPDPNVPGAIGKTVVPMHPDPARPNDGLVLTGGMNGCAFAITDVTPHDFTVWHVQSYSSSSNLGMTADFRAGKSVTDWFGVEEYMTPGQSRPFEVTNMLKHGENGWEVISHEVVDHDGEHRIGRENRRPLNFAPPTEADRVRMTVGTYEATAREQLSNFDRAAELALRGLDRNSPAYGMLEQQIGQLRGHLTGQLDTVIGLQQPGHSLQDVRSTAQQLAHDAAGYATAANDSRLLIDGSMRMLLNEPAGFGAGTEPHSRQEKIDTMLRALDPQSGGHWIDRMGQDSEKQLQAHQTPRRPAPAHRRRLRHTRHRPPRRPAPPPPAGDHDGSRHVEPMDIDTPPAEHAVEQVSERPVERDGDPMDVETPPTTPVTERPVERDGDPMEVETPPATPAVEHPAGQGEDVAPQPQPQPRNERKRGREDEEVTLRQEPDPSVQDGRDAKRQRTPGYENSDAVMHDRGYRAVGPQHELTGRLVDYLGGAPKVHPPMSNLLLHRVNPHESPVLPAEGFQPGNDLKACLENVEAYRDTHFGRPRVSGQTLHGTVEPIPGDVLWKRHDPPARFGEGPDALRKLIDTVKDGGPGSFATVLGAGPTGAGHAVALVHDRDGQVRWADLTERKVHPADSGQTPPGFHPEWTVWASVADPRESNISGTPDRAFMERYSTLVRPEAHDTSEPMDIDDGFGGKGPDAPPRTEVLEDHRAATPEDDAPQPGVPPQPGVAPQVDRTVPVDGRSELPQTGPVGGVTRPRSASAPAELGPRTAVPSRSEPTTQSPRRSPSPETAEHTAPLTPKSEHPADVQFPPPGRRVPVAGDGYCLLRSVAVGAPELAGRRPGEVVQRLQAVVGDHFRSLRPDEWPTEVVANYRGTLLSRPDLRAEDLLNYLPPQDRQAFTGLSVDQLRDSVGRHLTDNPPPPMPHEREALLRTVDGWDSQWRSNEGEMLPAATAHALDLRLRVVDHDGITQAVFGPSDGRPVTVYRQSDHYDGSEPPPVTTDHDSAALKPEAKTPEAEQQPPLREPEPGLESKPELKAEAEPELTAKPEQKPQPEPKLKPEPEPEPSPKAEAKPEPGATEKAEPEAELKPGPEPEQQPESEPEQKPEPEAEPEPEAVGPKVIAGTDLVVGLTGHEVAVREKVIEVIAQAVPGDRAAARAFADAYFGPATLRPMLGALSRGEVWTAPFEGNGWSGSVQLRGSVAESRYLRTDRIEFENGADRTVATGTNRDAQWQFNIGAQARQGRGIGEPSELVAYYHDRGHGEVNLDLGGMVARSKTNEPAKVFSSTMRLELDFGGLRHHGTPVRGEAAGRTEAVDVEMTVAVPVRDGGTSAGELRVPPQRLLDGRVGGQEIVLDLAPRGASGSRPPVAALLDHAEAAAKQEFGGDWPALREKVLNEVDFARLQRDLKSMTAGEPVSVTLTDRRGKPLGSVEITARVGELKQSGTTKETEFNIGTTVQQVRSSSSNRGNAGQFGFSAAVKPGTGLIGGGGAGRLGRDHVEISGDARTSQLTSKSKVPGVLYDGTVHFELAFNGKGVAHDAGTADLRVLVDRADTTAPPVERESGTPEPAKTEPTGAEPELHEVVGPPDSVWHGGDDRGGLGESVVVRDLESTAALRQALDAKGRERFGDDWNAVRDQVMQGFSQPNLAARLTGMTRGEALEVKIPGKEGLVVTAVARVESMTYRREDGKAELNTVNETSAFAVDRRLGARTTVEQGQLGGTAVKGTPGLDLVAAGSGQQRQRVGGQGRQADRVYASGKYSAPQVIYGAELKVDLHVGRPGEALAAGHQVSAPLRVEVGMDARDTVKTQAPRSEDGVVAFRRPERQPQRQAEPKPAGTEAATHTAPRRMRERHELNASYVVHTLGGADKVRTVVEDAVRSKYGEPSEEVKQRIGASFDRVALKTQLSQLTRGGRITETVSGKTWSAEVTVTARLGESTYHSRAEKYEFESGTRTSSGQGNLRDHRNRTDGGGQLKVKAPFVDVNGGYAYRVDRSYGQSAETVGSASNRGKHVEPAVLFDVAAPYEVTVAFKRLNVPDGSHRETVETVARVAVPERDADPVAGPVERTTAKQPKGFVEGRRLDSSAIVTDVHALPDGTEHHGGPGGRRTFGESVLSQVESGWKPGGLRLPGGKAPGQQKLERNPFDSDWAGIRRKLDAELTPDRLQSRLKGMTAGDEIVVRHGRTTVRVGAVLRDRMEHLGDSGTTEFNAGTDVQRSFARTDGTGTNHQGTLGAVASVPVPAAPGVSVTGGLTGTGGRGHDQVEVQTRSTAAGSATKAKLPGSAYAGEAELQFTITRRPWIGAQVHQRRTAAIGFEALVETGETVPVPSKSATGAGPDGESRTVAVRPPEPVTVQVPPERVWESGLRDTDVLRWLGDVGGVQDLVRLRGPEYFGASAWKELAPVVGTVTSHSHLSALFGTATQGSEVAASVPSKRVTLGGGKGVEVGVKVVSLEHRAVDDKVELSPANGTSAGGTRYDLAARNAGLQGQLGAKITGDVTNSPAVVGGAQHLWRDGGGHGDSGQVISNGKFATPMARYAGHAEVEVTLFDGARNPVKEKGIVPFAVDIPLSETTGSQVPGDHYLAFTGEHQGGELRVTEGGWRLEEVHRVTAPDAEGPSDPATRSRAEHEQLVGTVRLGQAVYEGEFSASTPAGAAHIRATHRLVELGGGTSAGTSALLGELLGTPDGEPVRAEQVRRVIDWVERRSADGPVTRDDLLTGAQHGWSEPEESA
ncbi:hypothetical protein KCH_61270 [Kitasatospora cheerisanensis KCTC 2395]|uniref:Tox-PL domain-containing protein n=2 Tax=Kitasatospora cheerisanensis TaxID=81942 RepID=A0A066YVJ8_9ACTN|nr:hypothetical protein KCH_61270 [Kitasatospora cheerisanensis KCTC 2395]